MSKYREGRSEDFPLYKPFSMSYMPEAGKCFFYLPVIFSYVFLIFYPWEYSLVSLSVCVSNILACYTVHSIFLYICMNMQACAHAHMWGGGWDRPLPPFNGVLNLINRKCKGGSKARIFFYSLKKLKYTMQMSIKKSLFFLKKYTANRFSSRRLYYSYAICMFPLP
jgi:hypothetical protein